MPLGTMISHLGAQPCTVGVLLPICFPASVPGKAAEDDPRAWVAPILVGNPNGIPDSRASAWHCPSCCGCLGQEPADGNSFCLTFPLPFKQINKYPFKKIKTIRVYASGFTRRLQKMCLVFSFYFFSLELFYCSVMFIRTQ